MKTRGLIPVVAVVFAAFTLASSAHAQSNVVLTLKMSTNGLTHWQAVHTVVTNMPASPQAFYQMDIVLTNVAPPPPSPTPTPTPPPPSAPTNMALIPAGSFSMGNPLSAAVDGNSNEFPVHTVDVRAFYMDQYEVTKELWDDVANWAAANGYDISAASASGMAANHPAYSVTWYEAVKWSNARSQKEGLTPCYTVGGAVMKRGTSNPDCNFAASGYRLPTEAEWEKAARGGLSGKRFPWGDTINHTYANYYNDFYPYESPQGAGHHPSYLRKGFPYSSPVGSFAPNGYNLYDMAGNMWEWCWDWYDGRYYAASPSSNPTGPVSGSNRIYRGGSWNSVAYLARTEARGNYGNPDGYWDQLGFRCARSLVP